MSNRMEQAEKLEQEWNEWCPELPVTVQVVDQMPLDGFLVMIRYDPNLVVDVWGTFKTTCPSEIAGGTDKLWKNWISEYESKEWTNYYCVEGVEMFLFKN